MSLPSASLFEFDFFEAVPVQIEASDAPLTSDAGLLSPRQFDERIGLTKQFAAALDPLRPLVREAVANRSIARIDRLRAIVRSRLSCLARHPDLVQPVVGFRRAAGLEL